MKWIKTKHAEEEYSFTATNKKTKFEFYICFSQGEVEITSFYPHSDEPFYQYIAKIYLNYKDFYNNELEFYKLLLIGNTATKLQECAQELIEWSEKEFKKI